MVGRRWPGCVLALLLGLAGPASAQERPPPGVELRENYPNPFFPSTTIPFVLNPDLCERGHQPLVPWQQRSWGRESPRANCPLPPES